jgi:hypothetical protein
MCHQTINHTAVERISNSIVLNKRNTFLMRIYFLIYPINKLLTIITILK